MNLFRAIVFPFLAVLAFAAFACSGHRPSAAPSIKIVCKDGTVSACPRDSHLLFQVNGLSGKFYLSAYLEDLETRERSWIAPSAEDDPMMVQVHPGEQVLARTVPLSVLNKGTFKVSVLLTSDPVTRRDLLQGKVVASVDDTSTVTVTRATGHP